jgi:polyphosphate kinase
MTGNQLVKQTSAVSIGDDGVLNHTIPADLSDIWLDRDLSWFDFNERVLAEALDVRNPLLERAKFPAIFTANVDEFFMKRISALRQSIDPGRHKLLQDLNARLVRALAKQASCFHDQIVPGLAEQGVFLRHWQDLSPVQQAEANDFFDQQISPALTPLVIHPGESFPFLSNLSTSIVVSLDDIDSGQHVYGRVKVPAELKHWIRLGAAEFCYVRLHEAICANLHKLYPGMSVGLATLVRLTRDAEVEENETSNGSALDQVREQVRRRRYEPVVRPEFAGNVDPAVRTLLRDTFHLQATDLYEAPGELDYTTLFELLAIDKPELKDVPWTPVVPPRLRQHHHDFFSVIREGDLLVHHPYESFDASVERFIKEAAGDPATLAINLAIKMTVYRVGDDTPFVKSLIRAAEAGKQVACVIELKARSTQR